MKASRLPGEGRGAGYGEPPGWGRYHHILHKRGWVSACSGGASRFGVSGQALAPERVEGSGFGIVPHQLHLKVSPSDLLPCIEMDFRTDYK